MENTGLGKPVDTLKGITRSNVLRNQYKNGGSLTAESLCRDHVLLNKCPFPTQSLLRECLGTVGVCFVKHNLIYPWGVILGLTLKQGITRLNAQNHMIPTLCVLIQ